MQKTILFIVAMLTFQTGLIAQEIIPLDTLNWEVSARGHVFEKFEGKNAVYLQAGRLSLKNKTFLNGVIEYDIYLKGNRGFPGVYFRTNGSDAEQFYLRPHQSGNPDSNQAAPTTKGVTPWQLYHGPKYSFPYTYKIEEWTHVKLVVQENKAQIFLDYSEKPNLSWQLFHETREGGLSFSGGGRSGLHLANFKITYGNQELVDFKPGVNEPFEGIIEKWELSDKFQEAELVNPLQIEELIAGRTWGQSIEVEEGMAANISRKVELRNDAPGNTVFAKVTIDSNKDQTKLFEFGYSDRVIVFLNGKPIYRGNNGFVTRDYRYLGTIGLFDSVYLNLKKGKNTLLLAISEDFGGWLVTGRFPKPKGLQIE